MAVEPQYRLPTADVPTAILALFDLMGGRYDYHQRNGDSDHIGKLSSVAPAEQRAGDWPPSVNYDGHAVGREIDIITRRGFPYCEGSLFIPKSSDRS